MKLITGIINKLINKYKSMCFPVFKTKLLASHFQNEVLINWVSKELEGYDSSNEMPDLVTSQKHKN